jgi:hypothetical protein
MLFSRAVGESHRGGRSPADVSGVTVSMNKTKPYIFEVTALLSMKFAVALKRKEYTLSTLYFFPATITVHSGWDILKLLVVKSKSII